MKKSIWFILGILALGTILRVYNLTAISLWHDEAFSALLINYSWEEMLYRIGLDVHPPAYYALLRFWAELFGDSLGSLRGFSVFFGVGTIYAAYLFIREAFKNEKLALLAALLIAINPFQIQYVTEARMYTLGAFLIMFAAYLMVKAFNAQKKLFEYKNEFKEITFKVCGPVWGYWLLFAFITSLTLYTHYYLFFSAFAIGLFIVYYLIKTYGKKIGGYKYAFTAYLLVGLSYIPWLPAFQYQFSQVQDSYWIPAINKWSILLTNWRMLAGVGADATKYTTQFMIIAGALFSLYMLWRVVREHVGIYKNFVLLGLFVPFIGALALSLKQSIYMDRYFLFAALFYTIALCMFLFDLKSKKVRNILFLVVAFISIFNYAKGWKDTDVKNHPGMDAASRFLTANVMEGHKLLVGSSFEFFNFKYYNQTPERAYFYAPGIRKVSDLPHFSGTAILTDEDLIYDLTDEIKKDDIVWMLWTNAFGGSKPEVSSNLEQIAEYQWSDIRPYPGTVIFVTEYIVR